MHVCRSPSSGKWSLCPAGSSSDYATDLLQRTPSTAGPAHQVSDSRFVFALNCSPSTNTCLCLPLFALNCRSPTPASCLSSARRTPLKA
jgi:hypothetical protein